MKDNYTHVSMVVDRSGSMTGIRDDAQGGINTFIKEQKQVEGKMTFSLYEFDDEFSCVHSFKDIQDVEDYTLTPRGMTALLDAVGKATVATGEFLAKMNESDRPSKVIFVVVTDGYENASVDWKKEAVKDLVSQQENDYNWEFVYLGANVDAFGEASSMGIGTHTAYASTGASTRKAYSNVSNAVTQSRLIGSSMNSNMPKEIHEDGSTS